MVAVGTVFPVWEQRATLLAIVPFLWAGTCPQGMSPLLEGFFLLGFAQGGGFQLPQQIVGVIGVMS